MENNKTVKMKKILLLIYFYIGWVISAVYTFIDTEYSQYEKINTVLIIISFIVTTVFYYIFKNWVLRLFAMIAVFAGLTVVIGYEYSLTVFAAFAVIYVYKSSITENNKNEIINGILFVLAPIAAITGLIINIKTFIKRIDEIALYLTIFVIAFLILIKFSSEKKSKKKLEKTNKKDREIAKKMESKRKILFIISVIGVLSSAASYKYAKNNNVSFFPWFCFILTLLYEEDKSLRSASTMLVNKIKAFVE